MAFGTRDDPHPEPTGPTPTPTRVVRIAQRIRARRGGAWVADTTDALVLRPPGKVPAFWIPADDVDLPLEEQGEGPGDAFHGTLEALGPDGGPTLAWRQGDPAPDGPDLGDRLHLAWDEMASWWAEDQRIRGHARDPFKRIDVHPSSRQVRVQAAGAEVAATDRPVLVFETGLPTRYYVPPTDVDLALLEASGRRSRCAYKGEADHYDVVADGDRAEAVAWSYPAPTPRFPELEGLVAFYNERVRLTVDGEEQPQPESPWS